ncbi:TPA: hypothetical protein NGT43_003124 [Vibrio parahaemolyticus]|nr:MULTISPECIES: hypothetical protein [Vibrio]EGR2874371.1 hypothetical protein [Vibrio parahaemolyticus]EIU6866811.1 hypothetical protein [Vibrio parahaemolyticus]EJF9994737.1 hypothetical protein [Vibrio parahaemolyticus]EJG0198368.1 hypothetical protein [Vibrio parahaemolyticus]MBD6969231.1 hypothetical protein [Vibrio parahaemolyticus]
MDKEALMSEIKKLEKREDYRGLIVKIEENTLNNWTVLVEKYGEKLEEAQSLSSVNQRVKITLYKIEMLAEKYRENQDLCVEISANQKEVERLRAQVLSNKDRLFDFNTATPFPSVCSFTVTKHFLKGCRDYLHKDWKQGFCDDLKRYTDQTLTVKFRGGEFMSCANERGKNIPLKAQTLSGLVFIINCHCDTRYWLKMPVPQEMRWALEQGAKRGLQEIVSSLDTDRQVERLFYRCDFDVSLKQFCKALIEAIPYIQTYNHLLDDLSVDKNKEVAIRAVSDALDTIGWDQIMLAEERSESLSLYHEWGELVTIMLSHYLWYYHTECLDKSMFDLKQFSTAKPKIR